MLEELGVPYEIKRYQRDAKTMLAPPELRAVHPLGKSPVITDGELTLAESSLIIQYLGDRYGAGQLIPPHGTPARLRADYWLAYSEGSAMTPLLLKLIFGQVAKAPAPFFVKPVVRGITGKVQHSFIDPQIALHLNYQEGELAKSTWFGGEAFGVSDIAMSFPLEAAASRGGLDESRPKLAAFLKRIHARPAYQRALERGGEYALAS
jgi:glutathione S-transferase